MPEDPAEGASAPPPAPPEPREPPEAPPKAPQPAPRAIEKRIEPTSSSQGADPYELNLDSDEPQTSPPPRPTVSGPPPSQLKKDAPREDLDLGDDDSLSLDLPPDEPAESAAPAPLAARTQAAKCPSCGSAVKPGAVICINCGFNFKSGKRLQTHTAIEEQDDAAETEPPAPAAGAPAKTPSLLMGRSPVARAIEEGVDAKGSSKLTDIYVPCALIFIGIVGGFGIGLLGAGGVGVVASAVKVIVTVVLSVPLMFVAILLGARIAQIAYGPITLALLKLTAIAIGPGAIGDLVGVGALMVDDTGLIAIFVRMIVAAALYWGLTAWLFSLDMFETFVTIALVFIIRNVLIAFIVTTIGTMFTQ